MLERPWSPPWGPALGEQRSPYPLSRLAGLEESLHTVLFSRMWLLCASWIQPLALTHPGFNTFSVPF